MSASEAWLITLLGISTVFFGLVLCIVFINLFGKLSARISWNGAHSHSAPAAAHRPEPEPAPVAVEHAPVPPEIQAVIATVLEIEQRLFTGRTQKRLTLRRNDI